MSEDTREKYLKIALVVFGVIFLLIYPLGLIWPSGWIWHGGQGASQGQRSVLLERSGHARVLLSTARDWSGERTAAELTLDPNEAVIVAEES